MVLTGCATEIDFQLPGARFHTPEVLGDTLKAEVGVSRDSSHKFTAVEVVEDIVYNASSGSDSVTGLDKSWIMGVNSRVGLLEYLDIYYHSPSDAPSFVGLKLQLIGDGEAQRSSGLKMAIATSYAFMNEDQSDLTFTNPTDSSDSKKYTKSNIAISAFDVNLIIGARRDKKILFYVTTYYTKYNTQSDLESTTYGNVSVKGDAISYGALLGVKLSTESGSAFLQIEGGYSRAIWEDSLKQTVHPFAVNFGFTI